MSAAIMEGLLRDTINGDRFLAARDCRVRDEEAHGVAVEMAGALKGTWHWRNGCFELVVGASATTVAVDTVAEALLYTREQLCPS